MKLKTIVCIVLTLVDPTVQAETKYLLIDAGASREANYVRYYNSILTGYELLKGMGKEVYVMAKDGTWHVNGIEMMLPTYKEKQFESNELGKLSLDEAFAAAQKGLLKSIKPIYPPIKGPASNLNDIKKILLSYKNGDTLYLHLTGHGGPPTNLGHPESATVSFFGHNISYHDLASVFKEFPNLNFKIYAGVCFAGGIHHLARSLNNVCAASVVPYFSASSGGSVQMSIFEFEFWKSIKNNSRPSLGSVSLETFKKDITNFELGSMSSFDYVDFVLKKGPYEKIYDYITPIEVNKSSLPKDGHDHPFWDTLWDKKYDYLLTMMPPNGYTSTSSGIQYAEFCKADDIIRDLNKVQQLSNTLNKITEHVIVQNLKNKADQQPTQVRTIFHDVIDDMKQNIMNYYYISQTYHEQYNNLLLENMYLEKEYQHSLEKKTLPQDRERATNKRIRERADIIEKLDTLKAATNGHLKQYFFNREMLDRLSRLEEFSDRASPEQKKKFLELLKCEWEPF